MRLRFQGSSIESTLDAAAPIRLWREMSGGWFFSTPLFGTTGHWGFCVARGDVHQDFFLGRAGLTGLLVFGTADLVLLSLRAYHCYDVPSCFPGDLLGTRADASLFYSIK